MSLAYQIVITLDGYSLAEGIERAARARMDVIESELKVKPYTSKLDGREYRLIGALGFPRSARPVLYHRIGCTTSDMTALLNFASLRAGRGLSQFSRDLLTDVTNRTQGVRLSRPLTDYGNDLHLVVSIPETVPVGLTGVDPTHTLS